MRSFQRSPTGAMAYWEGEMRGYAELKPPVEHRRAVLGLPGDCWVVLDHLCCDVERDYRLHWLLADHPCEWDDSNAALGLQTSNGHYAVKVVSGAVPRASTLVRGDDCSGRGWHAPSYLQVEPALSLSVEVTDRRTWFGTVFAPGEGTIADEPGELRVRRNGLSVVIDHHASGTPEERTLVRAVECSVAGETTEIWEPS